MGEKKLKKKGIEKDIADTIRVACFILFHVLVYLHASMRVHTHILSMGILRNSYGKRERERLAENAPIDPNVLHGRIVSRYVSTVINTCRTKFKKKIDSFIVFHLS